MRLPALLLHLIPAVLPADPAIERVWLTHKSNDTSNIVINWATESPGPSIVRYGKTSELGEVVRKNDTTTLHHVEIPLENRGGLYHYQVGGGDQWSSVATFKAYPKDLLRVAIVANWQGKPDLSQIIKDDIHLLATGGDNIADLWKSGGEGRLENVEPYLSLVHRYPALFRSTPFMPVPGNHDREIRPRGPKPPTTPVYDIKATAFRRFFELPDDEWKWHLKLPDFGLRLIALDLHHISDFGTTWQSCHAFDQKSAQFQWYDQLTITPAPFTVTLYNERNLSVRHQADKRWHELLRRGTCAISGFGYFAERAEVDGVTYYNTSLNGRGDRYPDPHSKFLAGEDSYLLLTVPKAGAMTVAIKGLSGEILDQRTFNRK